MSSRSNSAIPAKIVNTMRPDVSHKLILPDLASELIPAPSLFQEGIHNSLISGTSEFQRAFGRSPGAKSRRGAVPCNCVRTPDAAPDKAALRLGQFLPESDGQDHDGSRDQPRHYQPVRNRPRSPALDAAQRVVIIPCRLIKEASRGIVGHKRHPIASVPGGDFSTL
jgi:hypothetical protein